LKNLLLTSLSFLVLQATLCGWPRSGLSAPQTSAPKASQPPSNDRVVLSIGDQKMTAGEIEQIIQALPPDYRAFYSGQGRRRLAVYILRMKLLSSEAIKEKLDQQPEVARAIAVARESILADAAQKHIAQGITVSDQELRDSYEKNKAQFEEDRAAHILIRTRSAPIKSGDPSQPGLPDAEARKKLEDIRKQILAGADFAQMAKQYSEDITTASAGGGLGILDRTKTVPPIIEAAHALSLGQVSDVIATPSGFEIIKLEQKRVIPFEEAKPGLESQIRQSKSNEAVQHLLEESHPFIDRDFFSGSPNQDTSAPPPAP
jgi:peptidyl-prolyl cis-trans isomerase C